MEGPLPMPNAMECLDVEHAVEPAAIVLDAEFRHLVPSPAPGEQALLEEALHRDGCREPLVVWPWAGRLILLVGYEVFPTVRLYRLPFRVVEKSFACRAEARMFIIKHHLARQYLTPLAVSYLRGMQYRSEKRPQGGDHRSAAARLARGGKTAEALAEIFGVSPATIRLDAEVAAAVLRIAAQFETDVKPALLGRGNRITRARLLALAGLPVEELKRTVGQLLVFGKVNRCLSAGRSKDTITLRREPAVMAATLVRRLGDEDARRVWEGLGQILRARRSLAEPAQTADS